MECSHPISCPGFPLHLSIPVVPSNAQEQASLRLSPPMQEESLRSVVGSRMGWLAFFFLGLLAAAFVVGEFEEVLQRNVALSYFMPLLIGHAGNSGSQSGERREA